MHINELKIKQNLGSDPEKIVDITKVIPLSEMQGDSEKDTIILKSMHKEAQKFLSGFKWCSSIVNSFWGLGVGGVVGVFLFQIIPNDKSIDEFIWIIVGDIPPLYITTENAPNPACALDAYIGSMEEWADAAISGKSIDGLVPVDAEPTEENGKSLKKRLEFIDREILSRYKKDLI